MTHQNPIDNAPHGQLEVRKYAQHSHRPPKNSLRVTLVRHGQTEPAIHGELFKTISGHADPNLTELGHQQAQRVCEHLSSEHITELYVSSLTRTHQTAAPLVALKTHQPVIEADLREVFLGEWEGGLLRRYNAEKHPIAIAVGEKRDWGEIPGAESNETFQKRTGAVLQRLCETHDSGHLVLFVHGGVVAALCAFVTGGDMWAFMGVENASLTRLYFANNSWRMTSFNETAHLDEAKLRTPAR